ncbi:MAG: GrpB family protein [Anaerolineae bacterium]|nr:GrpB family protein [Anaerolineales bacterium]MCQ3975907.1 GrpB family protein [Anaerolineae bacterium]
MLQIDEPITVVTYDPVWPQLFEQEQAFVKAAFTHQAVEVQHFGSTAAPGLSAKPIIDILVGLPELHLEAGQIEALAQLGYEYLGEAGVSGRLAFRKRRPQAFNIAVVQWHNKLWRDNLLLRDYLRKHPQAARRYEQHKVEVVGQGHTTLLSYSEQKKAVIEELLEQARIWDVGQGQAAEL